MNIIYKNFYEELNISVKKYAKYQKVLLLYDDCVTNSEINSVESAVKGECVFNKADINKFDYTLVYDGYKMLIFLCGVDSFLKIKFDISEFVNFFFCVDNNQLPYLIPKIKNAHNYLCLEYNKIDVNIITSVYFNKFYKYLCDIFYNQNSRIELDFSLSEITQSKALAFTDGLDTNFDFVDLDLIKNANIEYKYLPLVDYLLISAFQIIISAIRTHTLNLVDIYKSCREDENKIEQFYAMTKNAVLPNIIEINYNILSIACEKTKTRIKEYLVLSLDCYENIDSIINKMKDYCKHTNNLLSYLYLYNIFSY